MELGFGRGEFRVLIDFVYGLDEKIDRTQGTAIGSTPPPKAHEKPILWTAHHPESPELLTASGDGTVRVWGT